jgi:hypothetical protein
LSGATTFVTIKIFIRALRERPDPVIASAAQMRSPPGVSPSTLSRGRRHPTAC